MKTIVVALQQVPEWWKRMNPSAQKEYIKLHPETKLKPSTGGWGWNHQHYAEDVTAFSRLQETSTGYLSPDNLKKFVKRVGIGSKRAHDELLDQSHTRRRYSELLYDVINKVNMRDIQEEVLGDI